MTKINRTDLLLGFAVLGLSAGYLFMASQITESLLSDVVGAGGVPKALGWAMAALGAILCVRSLIAPVPAGIAAVDDKPAPAGMRPHWLALGLLAILVVYLLVIPYLGYIVATAMLVGAVAKFCGAPCTRNFVFIAIAGGLGLWLLFDPMLSIPLPSGTWWGGR